MGPTLVDELVEGMLAIGPWLPPHNGARLVVYPSAGLGDVLPIGLHVTLEQGQKQPSTYKSCSFTDCAKILPGMHQAYLAWPCEVSTALILLSSLPQL